MEMIERRQLSILRNRIEQEQRRFIQVLSGPRQVGKSTIIKQFTENTKIPFLQYNGEDQTLNSAIWISQIWEAARLTLKLKEYKELIIIIDEVQAVPDWSLKIKTEWDYDTLHNINIKVIVLGSSQLLLMKGLNESLAGRFENIYVNHWSYPEIKEAFGMSESEYVWFGGYPGSLSLRQDYTRWRNYIRYSIIDAVIKKDILLLTRIHKPALLENLFMIGCKYSSKILSYNKILGQLQDAGNTTTLSHYITLLDNAGLLSGLDKFSGTSYVGQKNSSPKFMVQNTAFIGATSNLSYEEATNSFDNWGNFVESAVGAHFVNFSKIYGYEVLYWRQNNDEVDFVLKNDQKVLAFEIKSGRTGKLSGMDRFLKQFSPDKVILIAPNTISWQELLSIDPIQLF